MQKEFPQIFSPGKPKVFGRSRMGRELEEYQWGDKDKSILFLSGFTAEDRPVSRLLLRWKNHLTEAEQYGGILGDFDLKALKNRCRIRLIPVLNPDCLIINRNGIQDPGIFSSDPLKIKDHKELNSVSETNLRGVNLYRNFNANWLKMKQAHPERRDLGPFPESESETASLTAHLRRDLPGAAVILRHGENALFYPDQATAKELREAVFLGHYAGLSVSPAPDAEGTPLQWLTHRGVKAIEVRLSVTEERQYPKLRDLLTMCAALT